MKMFRTYLVLTLAFLITLSAAGINISLHKCCGAIKNISFIGAAKECKMANNRPSKKCLSKAAISKKDLCCANQQISFKQANQSVNKEVTVQKHTVKSDFNVLFFYTVLKNWISGITKGEPAEKPSPGLFFIEALMLLLQQFRI